MRKLIYTFVCLITVLSLSSCLDHEDNLPVRHIKIQLQLPDGVVGNFNEPVEVSLKHLVNGTVFKADTDNEGIASFDVLDGLYEAAVSDKVMMNHRLVMVNGLNSNVVVNDKTTQVALKLDMSNSGSIVIKELYIGGCPGDNGKPFTRDQYVVLYNNSELPIDVSDYVFAAVTPYNSHAENYDYVGDELSYAKDKLIPAGNAVWYFTDKVVIESGKQLVVAFQSGVDHTITYSQSVDLSDPTYYCMYDTEKFDNKNYYPSPSEDISLSHHLKAHKFKGITSNAWTLSNMSPAFFLFCPDGMDLTSFVQDPKNFTQYNNSKVNTRAMVPEAWVIDGIEVYKEDASKNQKRLLPSVDAGYVNLTARLGRTLYRNVDKEATEALKENEGKLVYNYALGIEGSTDPSGIDAEASLQNGARIIYMDTNNSSKDFHQRSKSSLRK